MILKENNQKINSKTNKIPSLDIQNLNGLNSVKNLTEKCVTDASSIIKIIENCSRYRIVAETSKNIESSRSHAIFTIYVQNKLTNEKKNSI